MNNGEIDIRFPPTVPPPVGDPAMAAKPKLKPPVEEKEPDKPRVGLLAKFWLYLRSKRKLIVRISDLEMLLAAERMENERLGLALVNMERWTIASITAAERASQILSGHMPVPSRGRAGA